MTTHQHPKRRGAGGGRPQGGHRLLLTAAAIVGVIGLFAVVNAVNRKDAPLPARVVEKAEAPSFDERDVLTGARVSSDGFRGRNVLLFFSEGVMCQACFEQIRDLEQHGAHLDDLGIALVNVTNDDERTAREAGRAYAIRTPLVADSDRDMSAAYDVLDYGMHANTAGHTFVLVDAAGKIRWRRDYWIGSAPTMYVPPEDILAELPRL